MNPEAAAQIIDSVDARLVLVGYGERPAWAHGRSLTEWWEPGSLNEGRGGRGRGVQVEQGQESAPHPHPLIPAPSLRWAPPAEELATIFFTSGTTGHPKGCMITHANLCFEVEALPATDPARRHLPPGQHPAALAPVRADLRAALPAGVRRGDPLRPQPPAAGHPARAARAADHPHDRRAATADADGQARSTTSSASTCRGRLYGAMMALAPPAAACRPGAGCSGRSTASSAATCG